jgi:hypothetical protein
VGCGWVSEESSGRKKVFISIVAESIIIEEIFVGAVDTVYSTAQA